jgi:crotonobetainyl-CoA hydratase
VGEHRQGDVGVPRSPGSDLVVIEPGFVLGLLEAFLDPPADGQPVTAEEALRLGLVNEVVESEQVYLMAVAVAKQISAAAPLAVAATLRVARAAAESDAVWQFNNQALTDLLATDDAREGQLAFAEKRRRIWSGR